MCICSCDASFAIIVLPILHLLPIDLPCWILINCVGGTIAIHVLCYTCTRCGTDVLTLPGLLSHWLDTLVL